MALKYIVDIDLTGNELQNAALQVLATAPSTPSTGQVYYDSALGAVHVYNGSAWARVGLTADGTTITNSGGTISVGAIAISKVTGLQTELNDKLEAADLNGYATESYVTTAIGNVIDSAPAALDTLNELAEALGDDPNFAGSITSALGDKLDASTYTAADVLAKIKTVDGAGSGLDADTLDGFPSQYFIDYTNFVNTPNFGALASLDSVGSAQINDNSVRAAELAVSGNGSNGQFLRSDGDGTFTWATPADNNTTYSAGTGISLSGTTFHVNSISVPIQAAGWSGGTFNVDLPANGLAPAIGSPITVQVYEIVGSTKRLVMTDVVIDENTGVLSVELPAGDFVIAVQGYAA